MTTNHSTRSQLIRPALLAILAVTVLFSAGCPQFDGVSAEEQAALAAAVEAENQAVRDRLERAEAAQAEANEAAQKALAEREALLEVREEQLRAEEALRVAQARDAKRKADLDQRARQLAAREKELENYESNLEFQEQELRDRELALDSEPVVDSEPVSGALAPTGFEPEDESDLSGPEVTESPKMMRASIEPGRLLEIEFEETVSSATHRRGDTFSGRLVQDLTAEDGTLVVAAGAEVIGRVTEVTPLKKVGGRASIEVEFTHLVLSPTETIAISASFVEVGADKRKDKKKIAGAAIVGAILGRVLGGDGAESVLAGAAVGAAAGTAAVARATGKDAEIPAGQVVALQLEEVVTVEVEMTGPVPR